MHTDDDTPQVGPASSIDSLYREWFLDYASYVILDRAIPAMEDGLKPVQRRILHALFELEDGRFNKAANVVGHTMRYHPHGDMAIGDALVKLAQKDLLMDLQGNWGNPLTGDRAAAARYIEVRLSAFAKDVLFHEPTTSWQASYDGRNKEPVYLPVKFPLLLALGVEGIAVGLATRIMPHNFNELLRESIAVLRGHRPQLVPDFPSGGIADFSDYRDGKKGGKVRVRAVIEEANTKTLRIRQLPYGVTTSSLIDSILAAHDKNQIKVKKVEDNTAKEIDILVHLPPGIVPAKAIAALYAFTDCEVSISPNTCVIFDGKPYFCGVAEVLKRSALATQELLRRELVIEREKTLEKVHFACLERTFIEERIYRKIEKCELWEEVVATILKALKPFHKQFVRTPTESDCDRLTEIKIKRITRYDDERAREQLAKWQVELATVEANLAGISDYTVAYFERLLQTYGGGRERQTRLQTFGEQASSGLAMADQKLYVERDEGFCGTALKGAEFVCECSKLDEVIAFSADGRFTVTKVAEKSFVGKNIVWIGLYKRGDERRTYHIVYRNGRGGAVFAKRLQVTSAHRDKTYLIAKGAEEAKVLYFSVNPNGESEKLTMVLRPQASAGRKRLSFDFASLAVKTRTAPALMVTQAAVERVERSVRGASTLAAQRLWFDRTLGRLNNQGTGSYLGKFAGSEKLIALYQTGYYEILTVDPEHSFDEELIALEKWSSSETVISAIYYDGEKKDVYVKRLAVPDEKPRRGPFSPQSAGSKLMLATLKADPIVRAEFMKGQQGGRACEMIKLSEFMDLTSLGMGAERKLSPHTVAQVRMARDDEA